MRIASLKGQAVASSTSELRSQLVERDIEGKAAYWLWHESGTQLAIMVNRDDACLHFFPFEGHPGFHSLGQEPEWSEMVSFLAENGEPTEVPRPMVIPVQLALSAVEEYFSTGAAPATVAWQEL